MSGSFEIVAEDSNTLSRAGVLRLGSGEIVTPTRAFYLSSPTHLSESFRATNHMAKNLHETYSRISKTTLQSLNGDVNKQSEYVKRQYGLVKKLVDASSDGKHVVFHFSEYVVETKPPTLPKDTEIQYLIDLMDVPGTDAISVPAIYGLQGSDYTLFAKTFLELAETRQKKTVVGLIPYIAYQELGPLISLYIDEGLQFFAVDLRGRNPIASWPNVRFAIGTLRRKAKAAGTDIFVHALNTGCRSTPRQDVRPATDMLCIMAGFDSFGRSHVTPKVSADLAGPLRKASEEGLRLFSREDYGYHKLRDAQTGGFPIEQNATVTLKDVTEAGEYRSKMAVKNWFNAERQAIESKAVNRMLNEGEPSIGNHLQSKTFVDGRIRKILSKIWGGVIGMSSSTLERFQ